MNVWFRMKKFEKFAAQLHQRQATARNPTLAGGGVWLSGKADVSIRPQEKWLNGDTLPGFGV